MKNDGWSPDRDPEHANWLRQSWQLPSDLQGFLRTFESAGQPPLTFEELRIACQKFMNIRVAQYMPETLRAALIDAGYLMEE